MQQNTKVQVYQHSTALSKQQATEILKSIWPNAPETEVYKAALICQTYGLNPLMHHLALVPFKNKKTGETDWVTIMAIKATRLIAARKKSFSYIDETPRLMTDVEQQSILGEIDKTKLWAITVLQDENGNIARGYGFWPKDLEPYGTDKGNTKANMAMIRSERQAVDRMVPDALPQGVEVMDEAYLGNGVSVETVDAEGKELQAPAQSAPACVSMCPIHEIPFEKFSKPGREDWWAHKLEGGGWCNKAKVEKQQSGEPAPAEVTGEDEKFKAIVAAHMTTLHWKNKDLVEYLPTYFPNCHKLGDLSAQQRSTLIDQLVELVEMK